MANMKAARFHEFGGSDKMVIDQIDRPQIGADEILIEMHAASINPVDWKIREGHFMRDGMVLPATLGSDGAGDIVEVGANVTGFKVGEAVYGIFGSAFAEYVKVDPNQIALKPKTLDYAQAASLPVGVLTAWRSLVDAGHVHAGQKVLVTGAAGGVGMFGVQFAKAKGAHVIGTASGGNEAFVRELGADEFIDYTKVQFEDVVQDADIVFDTVGGETLDHAYGAVKPGGMLLIIAGGPSPEKAAARGITAVNTGARPGTDVLTEIANLIDAGKVKAHVSHVYPFEQVAQAMDDNQAGHTRGKIVLQIRA